MLKCRQCRQYYIPGFLDCSCRTKARLAREPVGIVSQPAEDQATLTVPLGATKLTSAMPPVRGSPQSSDTWIR